MKKSKKITISVLSALAAALIVVVGGILIAINYNVSSAPTVDIFDDGNNITLQTQATSEYKGYRFRFQTANKTFFIDSEVNNISLTNNDQIIPGTTYTISVCYLGEIEGSNSGYSETVQWTAYGYLSTPTLTLDEENDKLTWTAVENASSYTVFYGDSSIQTVVNEISLQEIPSGEREVFVVANCGTNQYRKSQQSNTVEVKVVKKIKPFTSITFDRDQLLVTLTSEEDLSELNIYINSVVYKVTEFNKEMQISGQYRYTFNIHGIYVEGATLGAAPISDEYNALDGDILYLEEN